MDYEWLKDVKAGDKVFVNDTPREVIRVTKTMIVVCVGSNFQGKVIEDRFNRSTGREIGGDRWHFKILNQPTQELWDRYNVNKLHGQAQNIKDSIKIKRLDKESMEKLVKMLEEVKAFVDSKENVT